MGYIAQPISTISFIELNADCTDSLLPSELALAAPPANMR